MKKTLMFLFCFFSVLNAKAANYEIVSAISNPYGFYNDFTAFHNVEIKNLQIGVRTPENPNAYLPGSAIIFGPLQDSTIEPYGTLNFKGNVNISRNLDIDSKTNNQVYNSIKIYKINSKDALDASWEEPNTGLLKFTCSSDYCVSIANLYTQYISSNNIKVGYNSDFTLKKVYTHKLTLKNGANSFEFPSNMRNGKIVNSTAPVGAGMSIETACDSGGINIYSEWQTCNNSTCSECGSSISYSENENPCSGSRTTTKTAKQKRTLTYNEPGDAYDMKPLVDKEIVAYRKCEYEESSEAPGFKCVQPDGRTTFATEESAIITMHNAGVEYCGASKPATCSALCSLYGDDGCQSESKQCIYFKGYSEGGSLENIGTNIGAPSCSANGSGWEKGSGLECPDSVKRIVYTVYSCPANSDYRKRPKISSGAQTVYQCRVVTCPPTGTTTEGGTYCGTKFLTIK